MIKVQYSVQFFSTFEPLIYTSEESSGKPHPQATHDNFAQANVTLARQSEAHPLQVS